MYKDPNKQREANKAAKARYKAKQGIPAGEGIPGILTKGIPNWPPRWMTPLQWRTWMRERQPGYLKTLRSQAGEAGYKDYTQLKEEEFNRVALPGDADYEGPKGPGVCRKCGVETQSPLITCCYPCAIGKPLQVACEPVGANV